MGGVGGGGGICVDRTSDSKARSLDSRRGDCAPRSGMLSLERA